MEFLNGLWIGVVLCGFYQILYRDNILEERIFRRFMMLLGLKGYSQAGPYEERYVIESYKFKILASDRDAALKKLWSASETAIRESIAHEEHKMRARDF